MGNHPIIVSTCCSTLFLKSYTTAALHSNTAKLLSDDTLLHCPPPAEVQKACQGNGAATTIFLTWFYMLIPKGRSSFLLRYVHWSSFHFSLAPPPLSPSFPQTWCCGSRTSSCIPGLPLAWTIKASPSGRKLRPRFPHGPQFSQVLRCRRYQASPRTPKSPATASSWAQRDWLLTPSFSLPAPNLI